MEAGNGDDGVGGRPRLLGAEWGGGSGCVLGSGGGAADSGEMAQRVESRLDSKLAAGKGEAVGHRDGDRFKDAATGAAGRGKSRRTGEEGNETCWEDERNRTGDGRPYANGPFFFLLLLQGDDSVQRGSLDVIEQHRQRNREAAGHHEPAIADQNVRFTAQASATKSSGLRTRAGERNRPFVLLGGGDDLAALVPEGGRFPGASQLGTGDLQTYKGNFKGQSHFFWVVPALSDIVILVLFRAIIHQVGNLAAPVSEWTVGGTAWTSLMDVERRHGKYKPVIKEAMAELDGAPFKKFESLREEWAVKNCYISPGTAAPFLRSVLSQAFCPPSLTAFFLLFTFPWQVPFSLLD
ncbi:hypothetical protein MLD38_036812 [Melastoma candidum]|uniref:Uncharacterized protein n=1 Tax=Melastoma candidum TaxID=119954 RepID=A0ACB9LKC6_9MYRT|nr:hypothetical protein MLD38_036812 [Melastoma candidum]